MCNKLQVVNDYKYRNKKRKHMFTQVGLSNLIWNRKVLGAVQNVKNRLREIEWGGRLSLQMVGAANAK